MFNHLFAFMKISEIFRSLKFGAPTSVPMTFPQKTLTSVSSASAS